jgi:hypothetical protein
VTENQARWRVTEHRRASRDDSDHDVIIIQWSLSGIKPCPGHRASLAVRPPLSRLTVALAGH